MNLQELWEQHPEMVKPGLKIRIQEFQYNANIMVFEKDILIEQLTSYPNAVTNEHGNAGWLFGTVCLYCSWDKAVEGTVDRWYIDKDWEVILEIEGLEI